MTLSPGRQLHVERVEAASEALQEAKAQLAMAREEIGSQLAENARLSQQLADTRALLEHHNNQVAERRALVDQILEAARQLKERP